MANDVFANGKEVACKAADGKSTSAFPDVAFTPPQTPGTPPGVPIPYPNTAFAKDTANGSKSVKISGKPVMLKNKSYFKTSTGDEAGSAPKKGIVTSKIKGKAYFNSWSMDVKFEGENVVRHLDLTTHNHGSFPGNSPPWVYADSSAVRKACAKERKEAKETCEPSKEEKKGFKKDQERANKRRRKNKDRAKPVRKMGWKDSHCTGLMRIKPYTDIKNAKKGLEDAVAEVQEKIDNLEDILIEKGLEIAADKASKVAVRAGAKYAGSLFGGPFAPALAVISTAITVVDGVYSTATGAIEAYGMYNEHKDKVGDLKDLASTAKEQLSRAEEGVDLLKQEADGTLTEEGKQKLEKLKKDAADSGRDVAKAQALQAKGDACLRALNCTLTPYGQKQGMQAKGNKPQKQGCCPGQTGHHIPPKSYFNNCSAYDKDKALVVCASGVDQRSGSHGSLHVRQDAAASRLLINDNLSFENAIEASVAAHKQTFPESKCDSNCIRTQLEASLKKCKKSTINAIDKDNNALKPPQDQVDL